MDTPQAATPVKKPSSSAARIIFLVAYAAAVAAFIVTVEFLGDKYENPLWLALIGDISATLIVYMFSFIFGNTSIYDPYWPVFPTVICYYWFDEKTGFERSDEAKVALGVILLYSVKHVFYFFRTYTGFDYEDFRYKEYKMKLHSSTIYWIFSLLSFHLTPTLLVYISIMPLYPVITASEIAINSPELVYAGLIISLIGLAVETIADEQLHQYKIGLKFGIIDEGLWKYSRHPNYFGEIVFWFGLVVAAVGVSKSNWVYGGGALAIVCLILFYSIPVMEDRMRTKKPAYVAYQQRVSKLIFWIRTQDRENDQVEMLNHPQNFAIQFFQDGF